MKKDNILIRPILTEKFLRLEEEENKYAFQVNPDANKIEIRHAIEGKFDVKVEKVAVMNMKGKEKEMTIRSGGQVIRTRGRRSDWKKTIVTLVEGDNIDYYQGETAV